MMNCFYSISPEAAEVLKSFYLNLRDTSEMNTTIPITTRQIESLIRLAQARAKVVCRDVVTKDDAMVFLRSIYF